MSVREDYSRLAGHLDGCGAKHLLPALRRLRDLADQSHHQSVGLPLYDPSQGSPDDPETWAKRNGFSSHAEMATALHAPRTVKAGCPKHQGGRSAKCFECAALLEADAKRFVEMVKPDVPGFKTLDEAKQEPCQCDEGRHGQRCRNCVLGSHCGHPSCPEEVPK